MSPGDFGTPLRHNGFLFGGPCWQRYRRTVSLSSFFQRVRILVVLCKMTLCLVPSGKICAKVLDPMHFLLAPQRFCFFAFSITLCFLPITICWSPIGFVSRAAPSSRQIPLLVPQKSGLTPTFLFPDLFAPRTNALFIMHAPLWPCSPELRSDVGFLVVSFAALQWRVTARAQNPRCFARVPPCCFFIPLFPTETSSNFSPLFSFALSPCATAHVFVFRGRFFRGSSSIFGKPLFVPLSLWNGGAVQ